MRGEALTTVTVAKMSLERFASVLHPERFQEVRDGVHAAQPLFAGRRIWNVSSTARGGGVAEMLTTLLAYARGARVDARWEVIGGDSEFFALTKRIHNRLHGFSGDGGPLGEAERTSYAVARRANRRCDPGRCRAARGWPVGSTTGVHTHGWHPRAGEPPRTTHRGTTAAT
ncbi:MAG TPA: hypothetical protein VGN25_01025 [Solirubrobacteraceae bacterium]|nr:hypothetical protein [Solirubrobacteraceae bacterium]